MSQNNKDLKYWNRVAKLYGIFAKKEAVGYKKIRELISKQLTGAERVLEVGTGPGLIIGPLAGKMKSGLGTDISPEMIKKARSTYKAKNLEFRAEDATAIKEEDESFDLVIAANILHIVPEPDKVLKECYRVLKSDGLLIAPNFIVDDSFKVKMRMRFLKLTGLTIRTKWEYGEYQQFLAENGFCVLSTTMINSALDIAYVICKPEKGMKYSLQSKD